MLNDYLAHRAALDAAELRHWENRQIADQRHRETIALFAAGLLVIAAAVATAAENRPPAPNPNTAAAIADLLESVAELTRVVSELHHLVLNGNAPAQSDD